MRFMSVRMEMAERVMRRRLELRSSWVTGMKDMCVLALVLHLGS